FDQDIDGGTDGIAHGGDDINRKRKVGTLDHTPGCAERVELERRVAARDDFPGLVMKALRLARTPIPTVCIDAQAVVAAAADQLVHGLARGLAHYIPAGELDAGQGSTLDLPAIGVNVAREPQRVILDIKRVAAKH